MGDHGHRSCTGTALLTLLLALAGEPAAAQTADRTIDEIKTETLARSQTGAYPALGIQPADATEALGCIKTREPDEWAAAWSAVQPPCWRALTGDPCSISSLTKPA